MPAKLKYSLIMFVAGSCYGIVVPIVRSAYAHGFGVYQMMVTQYLVAVLLLALVCVVFSRVRVGLLDALRLAGVGMVAAGVSFTYFHALQLLPPATALTLLFQFVWMGMVVQALRERKAPRPLALIAVIMVMVGAVFACGFFDDAALLEHLDPLGVCYGLVSAAFYTAFLVLSGRVATQIPAFNRALFQTLGSLAISLVLCPDYFLDPVLLQIPELSLSLGIIGICLPIYLISLASPKLPHGLTTVMASSELPSGVVCAALFLGEPITLSIGLGVVIVLAGIVVSEAAALRRALKT